MFNIGLEARVNSLEKELIVVRGQLLALSLNRGEVMSVPGQGIFSVAEVLKSYFEERGLCLKADSGRVQVVNK